VRGEWNAFESHFSPQPPGYEHPLDILELFAFGFSIGRAD